MGDGTISGTGSGTAGWGIGAGTGSGMGPGIGSGCGLGDGNGLGSGLGLCGSGIEIMALEEFDLITVEANPKPYISRNSYSLTQFKMLRSIAPR